MTTIAMIAGMVPSALAYGAGGEFRAPMAYAVIGGLLCFTVLSLVFVPAVFVVMDNVSRFLGRLGSRFISKSEPEVRRTAPRCRPVIEAVGPGARRASTSAAGRLVKLAGS